MNCTRSSQAHAQKLMAGLSASEGEGEAGKGVRNVMLSMAVPAGRDRDVQPPS